MKQAMLNVEKLSSWIDNGIFGGWFVESRTWVNETYRNFPSNTFHFFDVIKPLVVLILIVFHIWFKVSIVILPFPIKCFVQKENKILDKTHYQKSCWN